MKSPLLSGSLIALMLLACSAVWAEDLPRLSRGGDIIHGGSAALAKAGQDTINLMAPAADPTNGPGEPAYLGDFEDLWGNPAWNGWTGVDLTQGTFSHWQVSEYQQVGGNHAAWCGDIGYASCQPGDPEGGYGNNWNDVLEFRMAVPHPEASALVTLTANLRNDSEEGYDYTFLSYLKDGMGFINLDSWTGRQTVAVNRAVTYQPGEYLGGTEIALYIRFRSDGGWSDADCMYQGAGACQIDDINVHLVNDSFTEDYFEDFEGGTGSGDFGLWGTINPTGVGDFARIWIGLEDVDPCASNYSPQVAFIDDGVVVPGTGGSFCINWCYGPGGYIVTTTGGLAGDEAHINNVVESPVMVWPGSANPGDPDPDGALLAFSVFRHEDFSADSPGMFYSWRVRSADTDNSAGAGVQDIAYQPWKDRGFIYFGGPEYFRQVNDVTDLLSQGRDEVQIQLGVQELGWIWGLVGHDGYPAPYFDNVSLKVFPIYGPAMSARDIDLAQDNFPEQGFLDGDDPGSNHVRFDMAHNIALPGEFRNDPGDSIVVEIVSIRVGADLEGPPKLHYLVDQNPDFDPYRTSGLPAAGAVSGQPAVGGNGVVTAGKWAFDLPDTGFLFPGDVLHYYITATDAIGGAGGSQPQTTTLPPDTTGFSNGFADPQDYDTDFTFRALPSVALGAGLRQPAILFIDDAGSSASEEAWYSAFYAYCQYVGSDYDVYHVNGPSSGVGNGIGGRASTQLLAGYTDILYTSGDFGANTLSPGNYNRDAGDDIGTLTGWLDLGGKDLFLAGDGLANDLNQQGTAGATFLLDYMGLTVMTDYIRPLISNQTAPRVVPAGGLQPSDRVFGSLTSWIAFGGCPVINRFDGVNPAGGGMRQAEFLDPSGYSGQYTFAAANLNRVGDSRVISMPMDLRFIYTDPAAGDFTPAHVNLVIAVLSYMGIVSFDCTGAAGDELPTLTFQVDNHPNPFNPLTTITYSLPRAGHLKLNIYNVRGQLIRTLVDEVRPAGENQTVVWDGTDSRGAEAASGVYFYEVRAEGESNIGKMTLLK